LIDGEATAFIGAEPHQRTDARVAQIDDLVKALGANTGISTSEVSRICAEQVASFAAEAIALKSHDYTRRPKATPCERTQPTAARRS
jgi:hypothetical protein